MTAHTEDPIEIGELNSYHRRMKDEKRVFIHIEVICNEGQMIMEIGKYTKLASCFEIELFCLDRVEMTSLD